MNALLTVSTLGGLTIRCGSTIWEQFRTDKARALLLYLVLTQPRAQRRDHLATLLWPESSGRAGRTNLRVALYDLRQGWTALTGRPANELLRSSREVVHLLPQAVWCDVVHLGQLLVDCDHHNHKQLTTCRVCLVRLTEAAKLARGTLLSGFSLVDAEPFNQWIFTQQQHVEDQTRRVLETLIDHHLEHKQLQTAIGYLRRLLDSDPWRESVWQQLITALGELGNVNGVEDAYAACQSFLLGELGVAPEQATLDAYEAARGERHRSVPPGANIQPDLLPFFGRTAEVERLTTLFSDNAHRLVTLVGMGGIGKTRLALNCARRLAPTYADGVWLVELEGSTPSTKSAEAYLLQQLAVTFQLPSSGDLAGRLASRLTPLNCLIVIDNMEHLLDGKDVLLDLLRAAPHVHLLVTSREPLNAYGETLIWLHGLDIPVERSVHSDWRRFPAVQLFVDSARRVRPAFRVSAENWSSLVTICRQLGGTPLAIKLAAALLQTHTLTDVLSAATGALPLLRTDSTNVPTRQRNLLSVLAATWQHLSNADRRTLSALSVFQHAFSLSAATYVAQCAPANLATLISRSLLQQHDEQRLILHPLLRQFTTQQSNGDERKLAAARHTSFFLQRLATIQPQLFGQRPLEAGMQLKGELTDCAAAMLWTAQHDPKVLDRQMLVTLVRLHDVLGRPNALASLLVDLQPLVPLRSRYHVQVEQARTMIAHSDLRAARQLVDSVLTAEDSQSATVAAYAYVLRGDLLQQDGYPAAARAAFEKGLSTARQSEERRSEVIALSRLTYFIAGTTQYNQRAVALAEEMEDHWLQRRALNMLGISQANAGAYEPALRCFLRLRYLDGLGDETHFNQVRLCANIGRTYQLLGEFGEALRFFERSLEVAHLYRSTTGRANAQLGISVACLALGMVDRALESAEAGAKILLRQPSLASRIFAHVSLGQALLAADEPTAARSAFFEALDIAIALQLPMFSNLARASLIDALLTVGDGNAAGEQGERIWLALQSEPVNRTVQPTYIYWQAIRALRYLADPRWQSLLSEAVQFVEQRAAEIHDAQLCHSYLSNVMANRWLSDQQEWI